MAQIRFMMSRVCFIFACILFWACTNEDVLTPLSPPQTPIRGEVIQAIEFIVYGGVDHYGGVADRKIDYSYDANWELSSYSPIYDYVRTFEFKEGCLLDSYHTLTGGSITLVNQLNDKGLVESSSSLHRESMDGKNFDVEVEREFTYNAHGQLVNSLIEHPQYVRKQMLTWNGPLLTTLEQQEILNTSASLDVETIQMTYSEVVNQYTLDLNPLLYATSYVDVTGAHLMKRTGMYSPKLLEQVSIRREQCSGFWDETSYRFECSMDTLGRVSHIDRYLTFTYKGQSFQPKEVLDFTIKVLY